MILATPTGFEGSNSPTSADEERATSRNSVDAAESRRSSSTERVARLATALAGAVLSNDAQRARDLAAEVLAVDGASAETLPKPSALKLVR